MAKQQALGRGGKPGWWGPGAPYLPEPHPMWGLSAELLLCALKQLHGAILWGPCVNRFETMPTRIFALLLLGLH